VSTLNVDKVDPSTGTTLEIGTSGDTINVPSGVTLDINSGATLDATGATITGAIGKVLQVVSTSTTNQFSTSSNTFTDCTPMTVDITPAATSSKVLVLVNMTVGGTADNRTGISLQRDSSDIFQGADSSNRQGTSSGSIAAEDNSVYNVAFQYLDSPSSTSALTYHIQVSAQTAGSETMYLNRTGTQADYQYTKETASSITVMEIGA
jgi:hypothetical protein